MDNQTSLVLVVYIDPTPVVGVAFNASTQEPITGGRPLADHVKHGSSIGPSVIDNVSLSFVDVKTSELSSSQQDDNMRTTH